MNPPHPKAAATLLLLRWASYPSRADRKMDDRDGTPGDGWQGHGPEAASPNRQGQHGRVLRAAGVSNRVRMPAPKRQQPACNQDKEFDNPEPTTPRPSARPALLKQPRSKKEVQAGERFAGNDLGAAMLEHPAPWPSPA
jgi:hypothetical protein